MLLKVIYLALVTEALVELIFKAAPLQGARAWFIRSTPFLRSEDQGHLLECKYCTSIWIGAGVLLGAHFLDCQASRLGSAALIVARLSNFAHLVVSSIRDAQINKRLERK